MGAFSDGTTDGSYTFYGHSTNIVVAECGQGQKVWAECLNGECIVHDNTNRYTTFSGMLLHAM